jgi:hypothetical protein
MSGGAHSGAHFFGRARRWFRRRSQRVRSALSQETSSRSRSRSHSYSISNSSKQSELSQKREKEIEDEEEESEQVVEIEESDIPLKLIRVPVRWNMAGLDQFKKVLIYFSLLLQIKFFCRNIWSFMVYVGWV